jgi:hypothetical protein
MRACGAFVRGLMPESGRRRNAQCRFLKRSSDERRGERPWQIVSAARTRADERRFLAAQSDFT